MSSLIPANSKVSIVIPFYNRENLIEETIESVIVQTFPNWEIILVDDGSYDMGSEIVSQYVAKYPGKIFLHSHPNLAHLGASASRNTGIANATGDFITFLDSDDLLYPNALEIELNAFSENPQADAVCGTLEYWFSWNLSGSGLESDFVVDLGVESEKLYEPPSLHIHNLRSSGRKPGMGCVMVRSAFVEKFPLFEDGFNYTCEDQICWAVISIHAKIYLLKHCLLKYRQHPLSSTSKVEDEGRAVRDWELFLEWLENYLEENGVADSEVWQSIRASRKEINHRRKFAPILNLYRKLLPIRYRYKIRDWILRKSS